MPTVLRIGALRFFFYSNEWGEPAHIHIQRDNKHAKFWLDPVRLSHSTRFSAKELRDLEKIVLENHTLLMEAWNDYFTQR